MLVRIARDADGKPEAEMGYAMSGGSFTLAQRAWHLLKRVG